MDIKDIPHPIELWRKNHVLTQEEISEILRLHEAWLHGQADGVWASLSGKSLHHRNLQSANLACAVMVGTNVYCADMRETNLTRASIIQAMARDVKLQGAKLREAKLSGSHFSGADLRGADLRWTDLRGACLFDANLEGADLTGADLRGANLSRANLCGANLKNVNLNEVDLERVDLSGALNADVVIARTCIVPEGSIIGWKACRGGVIVKLRVPENAKRSNAIRRECRAECVEVLEVFGAEYGESFYRTHMGTTLYRTGETVYADSYCENRFIRDAPGIYFFLTRVEAEDWYANLARK